MCLWFVFNNIDFALLHFYYFVKTVVRQNAALLITPLLFDHLKQSLSSTSAVTQEDSRSNSSLKQISLCSSTIHFCESQLSDVVSEIASYFKVSFGDRTRIDYGSGHELSFLCFLLCLYRLGCLTADDSRDVVLLVFTRCVCLKFIILVFLARMKKTAANASWLLILIAAIVLAPLFVFPLARI